MKRNRLTLADWSHIPTSTPENKSGWQSRSDFYAAEAAAEREKQEAPVKAALAQVNANMVKLNKAVAAFWAQSISDLAVANLWKSDAGVDLAFSVPKTRDSFMIDDLVKAFESWFQKYEGPHQFALGTTEKPNRAAKRLVWYALNQALNNEQDMSNEAAFDAAHARLVQLGSYGPDEIECHPEKAPVQPEPEAAPTLTEQDQVEADMLAEIYPLAQDWASSLKRNFGYELSKDDRDRIFGTDSKSAFPEKRGLFFVLNLNPLRHQSYDTIRKYMCNRGYWDENVLLTPDEKMAKHLESMEVPLSRLPVEDRYTLRSNLDLLR